MVDSKFLEELLDLEDNVIEYTKPRKLSRDAFDDETDSRYQFLNETEFADFQFNEFQPVYYISVTEGTDLYAVNFNSELEAESEFIENYGLELYAGIEEVEPLELTQDGEDINLDRGCPKDRIIRGAGGRFAGCKPSPGSGVTEKKSSNKKSVEAPKSINSKTNIAQLRAIAEKEGIKEPDKTSRRQAWIDIIKAKTGDKYTAKKSKSKSDTAAPKTSIPKKNNKSVTEIKPKKFTGFSNKVKKGKQEAPLAYATNEKVNNKLGEVSRRLLLSTDLSAKERENLTNLKNRLGKLADEDYIRNPLTGKGQINRADHKQLIKLGEELTKAKLEGLSKPTDLETKLAKEHEELQKKAINMFFAFQKKEKYEGKRVTENQVDKARLAGVNKYKEYETELNKRVENQVNIFKGIRKDLEKTSGVNEETAKAMVEKIKLNDNLGDKKEKVKTAMTQFYSLTGGQGSGTIQTIGFDKDRAYANRDTQYINVGSGAKNQVVFHEAGHHMEYATPGIQKAAQRFRDDRAESLEPKKLKDITGYDYFRDNEVALPDKFVSAYVGKVYTHGATEVVSVGIERFVNSKDMQKFYDKDPDHFNLIVGMIVAGRK